MFAGVCLFCFVWIMFGCLLVNLFIIVFELEFGCIVCLFVVYMFDVLVFVLFLGFGLIVSTCLLFGFCGYVG